MNSPLSYIGGKSRLSTAIISRIPEHYAYCEVFAGAGWVFFRKEPSNVETLNDLDGDLIAFYRVLQSHLEEFVKQFRWLLCSRQWFEDWKRQQAAGGLTDIQRAARYYYLQRLCFGGRVRNRTFGTDQSRRPRVNLLRLEEELSEAHLRLVSATVENRTWQAFLDSYDKPATFFYLDPPYYMAPYYKHNLSLPDYHELSGRLAGIQGKFLLSINDTPEMWDAFKGFNMKSVSLRYSVAKKETTVGKELLVSNYCLPERVFN